jgi:hypothetical protein
MVFVGIFGFRVDVLGRKQRIPLLKHRTLIRNTAFGNFSFF